MAKILFFWIFLIQPSFAGELRVLTFNTWLFPGYFFVSKDMSDRIQVMPENLAKTHADIIALQEVWTPSFKKMLIEGMKYQGYPFHAEKDMPLGPNFIRGWLGNGLLVFSKYPIKGSVNLHSFSEYTRIDEYPVRKGVLHFKLEVTGLGTIDVFNTHLGVVSIDEKGLYDSGELELLRGQAKELRNFIETNNTENIAVLTGDLNSHPLLWNADLKSHFQDSSRLVSAYQEIIGVESSQSGLVDTFHHLNGLLVSAYTFDVKKNSYLRQGKYANTQSEYIDYIFFRDRQKRMKAISSQLMFQDLLFQFPNGKHLSDHFGVMTVFQY